jgi:hypothetical protein
MLAYECHLQGDDICSYLWGERENREIIKVVNERDRQTYYGALNLWTQEFIVSPYSTGNGENTVKPTFRTPTVTWGAAGCKFRGMV